MAIILAYLIMFTIGINLLDKAGLFDMISNNTLCACIKGFFEMTVGINQMGMCNIGINMKVVLASMMVSFGGMSIVGQSASMAEKIRNRYKRYIYYEGYTWNYSCNCGCNIGQLCGIINI